MAMLGIGRGKRSAAPAIQPGRRIYAIGDVHGCQSLLARLLHIIESDHAARGGGPAELVFLGDLIDRGEDSAGLLRVMSRQKSSSRCRVLRGNHEATLSDAIAGDHDAMDAWLAHGGIATLRSFGVPDASIDPDDSGRMIAIAREVVPRPIQCWLAGLPTTFRAGDYFFVHAGIRPGVSLRRQSLDDLLWIRDPFLDSDADHGVVVVHGHSVREDGVEIRRNRIGVDTGAYRTGRLSALAIEGSSRWVLCT